MAASFPGLFPVNGREFPRLQLRGSAGFAPASHSSDEWPGYDLRKPRLRKSKNSSLANLAGSEWEVNAAGPRRLKPRLGAVVAPLKRCATQRRQGPKAVTSKDRAFGTLLGENDLGAESISGPETLASR